MRHVRSHILPGPRCIAPLRHPFKALTLLLSLFLATCIMPGEDPKEGAALSVINVTPNGMDPVDPGSSFVVEFDRAIDFEALMLSAGWSGISVEPAVTLEVTYDKAEKKLLIEPCPCLNCDTQYTITLEKTITGTDGSSLSAGFSWSFVTKKEAPAGDVQIDQTGTADNPYKNASVTLTITCNYTAKKYLLWDDKTPPSDDWHTVEPDSSVKQNNTKELIVMEDHYTFPKDTGWHTVYIQFRDAGANSRLSLVKQAAIYLDLSVHAGGK
jgi:hypothetical protein